MLNYSYLNKKYAPNFAGTKIKFHNGLIKKIRSFLIFFRRTKKREVSHGSCMIYVTLNGPLFDTVLPFFYHSPPFFNAFVYV